ncbi:MAG: ECF transporter S component [Clostridia bacterium]|nr:ECF transporter S component [Clostridia bacterium]
MNNKTKMYVSVGVFSAIAFVLQVIGSVMGLKVSGFLEIEISDLPALIMALALGPVAGVFTEFIKNLLHSTMTSTGFVGEVANFVMNGTLCAVAGFIYKQNKSRRGAVIALVVATFAMAIAGVFANLFIMLPLYMPTAPFDTKLNLVLFTILPFNIVRGLALSLITFLIYKRISPIIKSDKA